MPITHEEALKRIRDLVKRSGSQVAAAKELNISPAFLGDILRGARPISDNVAQKLGYRRVVQFVPVKEQQ